MTSSPYVIAVVGPTAVGKSELAQELCLRRNGVVISADAMQIYRGLDIGTAKMPQEERKVEHFGIDLVDVTQTYSAAQYQSYARSVIDSCFQKRITPIVAGGTGFYVRAALDVMEFAPGEQEDNPIRTSFEKMLEEQGADALYAELLRRDPDAEAFVHKNNTKRVIRALEITENGELYSSRAEHFKDREEYYPTLYIGLTKDRDVLYQSINDRVDEMINGGLLQEVETLIEKGLLTSITASQAIGYKELFDVVQHGASLLDAVESIKQQSRRYAKRQLSWFKSDPRIQWIHTDNLTTQQIVSQALEIIAQYESERAHGNR